MQNIPSRNGDIRPQFVPSEGKVFISADYSSQEPRTLAFLSKDEVLIDNFLNDRDIYVTLVAQATGRTYDTCSKEWHEKAEAEWEANGKVGPEPINYRNMGKILQLALTYGLGPTSLGEILKIPTDEAKEIMDTFKSNLSGVMAFEARAKEYCREHGFVPTLWGRKRRFPDYQLPEFTIRHKENGQVPYGLVEELEAKTKWKRGQEKSAIVQAYRQQYPELSIFDNSMKRNEAETQILNAIIQGGRAQLPLPILPN